MPAEDETKIQTDEGTKRSKVFTQTDVDRVLAQRLSEERKKFAPLQAELDQFRTVNEAAKVRVSELEAQLAGMAGERDSAKLALEASRAEHAGLAAKHAQALAQHRVFRTDLGLMQALTSAKVLPDALGDAVALMKLNSQIDVDDNGKVSVTYNGVAYETPIKAAEVFLQAKGWLVEGPKTGGGTKPPNAGGLRTHANQSGGPPDAMTLASQGWAEKPR